MKTMQNFLVIALLAILPCSLVAQDKTKDVERIKFSTSIDCATCVNKIMTNLPQEKGIKDVICDLKTKEVSVAYQKDKSSAEEIQKSLEKLGFTAKQVKVGETIPRKDK